MTFLYMKINLDGLIMNLKQVLQGTIIEIRVKPKSKRFGIKIDNEFVVFCREAPVKGSVNRELMKGLSRIFKKRVELISGFTSKQKKVLVKDIEVKEVEGLLKRLKEKACSS